MATTGDGGAVYVSGATSLKISSSTFTGNTALNSFGGAILATNSSITVTNNSFSDNSAFAGGAIASPGNRGSTISGNTFTDNNASYGGAIDLQQGGSTPVSIISNGFMNNVASSQGGAIWDGYENNQIVLIVNSNTFSSNTASVYGSGGAVYLDGSEASSSFSGNSFSGNMAGNGGAIFIDTNSTSSNFFTSSGDTFTGNSAYNGGAFYSNSNIAFTFTDDSFGTSDAGSGNQATNGNGGAIYVTGATSLTVNSNSSFYDNTASTYGGAIYVNGGSSLAINGDSFMGNSAVNNGGAVYATDSAKVLALSIQNSSFTSNNVTTSTASTATGDHGYGGAVYALDFGSMSVSGSSFTSNTDSNGGAAFYAQSIAGATGASLSVMSDSFTSNIVSLRSGAAIYAFDLGSMTVSSSNFTSNTSHLSGGAILANAVNGAVGGSLTINNNTFMGNTATGSAGGAIFSELEINAISLSDNTFANNKALTTGGAIALQVDTSSASFISSGDTFTGNSASVVAAHYTLLAPSH